MCIRGQRTRLHHPIPVVAHTVRISCLSVCLIRRWSWGASLLPPQSACHVTSFDHRHWLSFLPSKHELLSCIRGVRDIATFEHLQLHRDVGGLYKVHLRHGTQRHYQILAERGSSLTENTSPHLHRYNCPGYLNWHLAPWRRVVRNKISIGLLRRRRRSDKANAMDFLSQMCSLRVSRPVIRTATDVASGHAARAPVLCTGTRIAAASISLCIMSMPYTPSAASVSASVGTMAGCFVTIHRHGNVFTSACYTRPSAICTCRAISS
ncbi:hypothetical protein FKP32DRAFT_122843 [Trametes sanguinea]|nr:hypothetical protein FKP32DRAFT_122843 [Trametes sanguinea]